MKIEIDTNQLVEKIDIKKLVEERVMSDIFESSQFEEIVNDIIENKEVKNLLEKKIVDIIEEYLSSDKGKKYIIEQLEDAITNSDIISDIMSDDKITDLVAEFLKKSLMKKS